MTVSLICETSSTQTLIWAMFGSERYSEKDLFKVGGNKCESFNVRKAGAKN